MKLYTAEFRATGSYGTQIVTENTIKDLIETMQYRGCNIHKGYITELNRWEIEASEGQKFYGNCFTIRKGEAQMTEYTSL